MPLVQGFADDPMLSMDDPHHIFIDCTIWL